VTCTPTFGMYRFSADLCGARTLEVQTTDSWDVDPKAVESALTPRTKLIFLTTPNNPTGNTLQESTVRGLAATGRIVVLDEAYVEFSSRPSFARLVAEYSNVVVLRTFSKWAGLAGLRIGYGVFPPSIIEHLWKVKPPFNVNVAAEAAVCATLGDLDRVRENIGRIQAERQRMFELLATVPLMRVWPSEANFLLVQTDEPTADALKKRLELRGIAVRTYADARLRNALRISVGRSADTDAVLAAAHAWASDEKGVSH